MVGRVGIQAPLDRACRHHQRAPTRRHLDRLEVEPVDCTRTDERLDLGDDRRVEARLQAPFLDPPGSAPGVAPARSASHSPSLTSTSSPVSRRRRWYSAIC